MRRALGDALAIVAQNVERERKCRGMTVSELARESDVPRSTLRGWLAGGNMPVVALWPLARALTVDPDALLEGI